MQTNDNSKWYLLTVSALVLIAIAAVQMLRIGASVVQSQIGNSTGWEEKAVQVEQLLGAGQWYPREPLEMKHGYAIQGHSVGEPDFTVQLEPVYRIAGDPNSLYLARSIKASCADGKTELSAVLHDAQRSVWEAQLGCLEGTWRLKVVDSKAVLKPPVAKPGEMLPAT